MGLSGWCRDHQTRPFKPRSAAMNPAPAWQIFVSWRLWLPAFALSSLAGCNEIPHAWSESDIRDIAQDAAEDVMPVGVADAGAVDEAINDLRRQNELLTNIVDAQGRQIDALNDSISAQEAYIEDFAARYNSYTH